LSLKWHPDKNLGNEKLAEEKFLEIKKAYEALTDPEVREKWEKYGNPDGRMQYVMGIALPDWIIRKEYSAYIFGLYMLALLFVVLIVGRWWISSRDRLDDGTLQENEMQFLSRLSVLQRTKIQKVVRPFTKEEILKEICLAPEFRNGKLNEKLFPVFAQLKSDKKELAKNVFLPPHKETLPRLENVFYILNYHLKGIPFPSEISSDAELVVGKTLPLVKKIIEILSLLRSFSGCREAIHVQQMLIQAVWAKDILKAELSQLPHFNDKLLTEIKKYRSNKDRQTISFLLRLPENERRSRFALLDDAQYEEAMSVAKQIPSVSVVVARFFVLNEDTIQVGDLIVFEVKFHISYGQPISPEDLQKIKQEEKIIKNPINMKESALKIPEKNQLLPAYAPHFPETIYPGWWVILTEEKEIVMQCNHVPEYTTRQTFEQGTILQSTVQMRWPKVGKSVFTVHIFSDTYVGIETSIKIDLNQLKPQAEPPHQVQSKKEKDEEDANSDSDSSSDED